MDHLKHNKQQRGGRVLKVCAIVCRRNERAAVSTDGPLLTFAKAPSVCGKTAVEGSTNAKENEIFHIDLYLFMFFIFLEIKLQ